MNTMVARGDRAEEELLADALRLGGRLPYCPKP